MALPLYHMSAQQLAPAPVGAFFILYSPHSIFEAAGDVARWFN
jgi:hypothetical protein